MDSKNSFDPEEVEREKKEEQERKEKIERDGIIKTTVDQIKSNLSEAFDELKTALSTIPRRTRAPRAAQVRNVTDANGVTVIEKKSPRDYGYPFSSLNVYIRYAHSTPTGELRFELRDSTANIPALLDKCARDMAPDFFAKLKALLDSKFIGAYKYAVGNDVLKTDVKP